VTPIRLERNTSKTAGDRDCSKGPTIGNSIWAITGLDLGEGPGPRPPTNRDLPPNPSIFWLLIDVSLVILIEDFEINEN